MRVIQPAYGASALPRAPTARPVDVLAAFVAAGGSVAALEQAQALTSLGDRPLVVVSAGSGQQTGWLEAQDELPHLSTNSTHRVFDAATHTSLISGAEAPASTQAIVDVVAAIQSGTALR